MSIGGAIESPALMPDGRKIIRRKQTFRDAFRMLRECFREKVESKRE